LGYKFREKKGKTKNKTPSQGPSSQFPLAPLIPLSYSCKKRIRKAKAQLELRLGTVVWDDEKYFHKYIKNKKRAKENLHPLLDVGGGYCHQG